MKFEISRILMLEATKKAARVAPLNAPVDLLNGILLESRDDEVFLTATNLETSIQQKLRASVKANGEALINPRILAGILSLLPEDVIAFSTDQENTLTVSGGKCVYEINCQSAKRYPKPVIPFPEETVKISGICSLAKRTAFIASKDTNKAVLQCVNLQIRQNTVHAAACDGIKMMLVRDEAQSPDNWEFLLPAKSLQMLASISTDEDVFEVGEIGNEIVFTRENMIFTMRKIPGDFIDTNSILKSIKSVYFAVTDAKLMKDAISTLMVGAGTEPINVVLAKGQIILRRYNEYSEARTSIAANVPKNTPIVGYYYNIHHLYKLFQVVDGKIRLEFDEKGMMLIKSRNEVYVQTPQRIPVKRENSHRNNIIKEVA